MLGYDRRCRVDMARESERIMNALCNLPRYRRVESYRYVTPPKDAFASTSWIRRFFTQL